MYEDVEFEEGNVSRMQSAFGRKWQHWLDVSAPHVGPRWALASFIMLIYCVRVYLINGARRSPACGARPRRTLPAPPTCAPSLLMTGWYIITYGLGIYVLNLLIGFLSPQLDPETEGPTLPQTRDDEFRPFIRR